LDVMIFNNYPSEPAGHKVIQDEKIIWFLLVWGMTTKLTITATSILETKPIILLTFWFIRYIIISSHYNTMNYRKNYFCCIRRPTYFTIVTWLWDINFKSF
jgi:hypothetical protein